MKGKGAKQRDAKHFLGGVHKPFRPAILSRRDVVVGWAANAACNSPLGQTSQTECERFVGYEIQLW